MTDYEIIDRIIEREGGDRFTDRPSDRGGPTKFGITQRAWVEHRTRRPMTTRNLPDHVRDITLQHARAFYFVEHAAPFAFIYDDQLRELVIDCSVNHGKLRATKWLQEVAGVVADGVIGPVTKPAVNMRPYNTYAELLRRRFKFYAQIASDQLPADPDLPNLRGWINRACEFIR